MFNRASITGRLGRDPELRKTPNDVSVCSVSLACDRDYKSDGQRETDWIDCVFWRQTAEYFCRNFRKGDAVTVDGRLQMRKWIDKDGKNRSALEIHVENVYFASRKPSVEVEEVQDDGTIPF